jgi:N-acetylneuraminate synthase
MEGGVDSAFSMEPAEFSQLVREGNSAAESLGVADWHIQPSEKESRRLRRSLYIVRAVQKGEVVSNENIRAIRPGLGISPKYLGLIMGKTFSQDLELGTPLSLNHIDI